MGAKIIFSCFVTECSLNNYWEALAQIMLFFLIDFVSKWKLTNIDQERKKAAAKSLHHVVRYSDVDDTLEVYKIKSALPFKIFSTLNVFIQELTLIMIVSVWLRTLNLSSWELKTKEILKHPECWVKVPKCVVAV